LNNPESSRSPVHEVTIVPVLAAAFAISGPALAQTQNGNTQNENAQNEPAAGPMSAQGSNDQSPENTVLSVNKIKQELQKAGFTDVRILADSFVVQAKDKDGNPTVMTLSPSGVFAISEITKGNERQARARGGQTESRQ